MFPLLPQRFWESELSPNISLVPKCSLMYSEKVLKELYSLAGLRSFYKKRAEQIFVEQFLRKLSATVLKSISQMISFNSKRQLRNNGFDRNLLCSCHEWSPDFMYPSSIFLCTIVQLIFTKWQDSFYLIVLHSFCYVQSSLLKRVWFRWSTPFT